MSYFIPPNARASDANNNSLSGSGWHFFTTGTTTPAASYTTVERDTPHAHPVVADAGGKFPNIYLDPGITYRAQLKTAGGSILLDVDPYDVGGSGSFLDGLLTEAEDATLSANAITYQTSGHSIPGVGAARYVKDDDFDLTEHPLAGFENNGDTFRLAERVITPQMFGAIDSTGTHKGADEVVYDCSAALDAMWAFAKSRSDSVVMDLSNCRGLGISTPWELTTGFTGGWWNAPIYRIVAGRLVAMAEMADMVVLNGKSFDCSGTWELWGGTDAQNVGYSTLFAKNGMRVKSAATSELGSIIAQGLRRYALQFDKTESSATNNNIPIICESVMAVQCGGGGSATGATAALGFGGTYSAGAWTDAPGDNGSKDQRHRMTLTPASGVDVGDIEEGDLVRFNNRASEGVIMDIVSSTATTVTVDIFPWQPIEVTGDFVVMHGGAVSLYANNTANTRIGTIYNYTGGVALQCTAEYAPKIGTLLAESCEVAVQIGGEELEKHIEGLEISHYHYESVNYTLIDVMTAATGCRMGAVSNMDGTVLGKLGKARRLSAGYASGTGGTWTDTSYRTLSGWSIGLHGGSISTSYNMPAEKEGDAIVALGNAPEYRNPGPHLQNTPTVRLFADASIARFSRSDRIGRIFLYGAGTSGSPSGTTTIELDSTQSAAGYTLNGGTSAATIATGTGAIDLVAIFEPNVATGLGNWKIGHTRVVLA